MVHSIKYYKEIKSDTERKVFSRSSEKAGDSSMRLTEKNPNCRVLMTNGEERTCREQIKTTSEELGTE